MRNRLPVLTASLLALALAACSREETPTPAATRPALDTLTVGSGPAAPEQQVEGTLEAVNQATLSAQTSARIVALPVDVNETR